MPWWLFQNISQSSSLHSVVLPCVVFWYKRLVVPRLVLTPDGFPFTAVAPIC